MTATLPTESESESATATTAQDLLALQRAAFRRDGIPDKAVRIDRIDRMEAMLVNYADRFAVALTQDYGSRPAEFSLSGEILGSLPELAHMRKNLATWMRTQTINPVAGKAAVAGRLRRDPVGVVGVIGAWNFPVQLSAVPAATALAAGNRVLIRSSEITPNTSLVLQQAVAEYFDPEEVAVVLDDVCSGPEFSNLRFDHLIFTGSPKVGAMVGAAAAANLVPHTLELGGKNPVIVHRDADVRKAAAQIARARMVNGGQVCLCPDYVFVPHADLDEFVREVVATWRSMVPTITSNPEYTACINQPNFERVVGLLEDALAKGATAHSATPAAETLPDPITRKVAPTVLTGVTDEMTIASEEVFGPLIGVYGYSSVSEAVDHIGERPSPLTLYWFGPDNEEFEYVQRNTRSGSVNANDFALNMLLSDLPFGGVGNSGYGAYHGETGFNTFTHQRAVAVSNLPISLAGFATPPFTRLNKLANKAQLAGAKRRTKKVKPLH